ncbi:MAG: hypothetical protein JST54_21410 [Deltaproteobacteria bacterium]|nr:hypothetical protein [Deltaproteobacteria bacterium]
MVPALMLAMALLAAPATPACVRDADCVITDLGSCCGCRSDPEAKPKAEAQAQRSRCAKVDCAPPEPPCPPTKANPDLRAICRAGAYVAVPAKQAAECGAARELPRRVRGGEVRDREEEVSVSGRG